MRYVPDLLRLLRFYYWLCFRVAHGLERSLRCRQHLLFQIGDESLVLRTLAMPVRVLVRFAPGVGPVGELIHESAVRLQHRCVGVAPRGDPRVGTTLHALFRAMAGRRFRRDRKTPDHFVFGHIWRTISLAILRSCRTISGSAVLPIKLTAASLALRARVLLPGAAAVLTQGPLLWSISLEVRSIACSPCPMPDTLSAGAIRTGDVGPRTTRGAVIVVAIEVLRRLISAKLALHELRMMEFIRHFFVLTVHVVQASGRAGLLHRSIRRAQHAAVHGLAIVGRRLQALRLLAADLVVRYGLLIDISRSNEHDLLNFLALGYLVGSQRPAWLSMAQSALAAGLREAVAVVHPTELAPSMPCLIHRPPSFSITPPIHPGIMTRLTWPHMELLLLLLAPPHVLIRLMVRQLASARAVAPVWPLSVLLRAWAVLLVAKGVGRCPSIGGIRMKEHGGRSSGIRQRDI